MAPETHGLQDQPDPPALAAACLCEGAGTDRPLPRFLINARCPVHAQPGEPTATAAPVRPCPDGGALNIKGEHFPCTQMRHMAPECDSHEGWAHSNGEAEAIWQ